jgi:hypothetical protein
MLVHQQRELLMELLLQKLQQVRLKSEQLSPS